MNRERIDNLTEKAITWALSQRWIRRIWSWLPTRCIFNDKDARECDNRYLRWTEHLVAIQSDPIEYIWVCKDCLNKMRQVSFSAGHSVEHLPNGWVRYTPTSQEE